MSDHPPQCLQLTGARGIPVYPPRWYLDLVQLRFGCAADAGSRGMTHIVWNLDPAITNSDDAELIKLMALALEIVGPSHLEKLPFGHQAHILGLDVLEVRGYLNETCKDIGVQAPAATLIIEDEAAVALDLARIVRKAGHLVCGTAGHLKQAVAVAGKTHPALVLADVQLKDGPEAGIAAVREIGTSGGMAAVFVTAYPERVRQSVLAPLIVSKPFLAHNIQTAIWRALFRNGYITSAAAA